MLLWCAFCVPCTLNNWSEGDTKSVFIVVAIINSNVWQAQLDDTAARLAAQEAALRGSQQRQQLAALRAQLTALQHAAPTAPPANSAAQIAAHPPQHAGGT